MVTVSAAFQGSLDQVRTWQDLVELPAQHTTPKPSGIGLDGPHPDLVLGLPWGPGGAQQPLPAEANPRNALQMGLGRDSRMGPQGSEEGRDPLLPVQSQPSPNSQRNLMTDGGRPSAARDWRRADSPSHLPQVLSF